MVNKHQKNRKKLALIYDGKGEAHNQSVQGSELSVALQQTENQPEMD